MNNVVISRELLLDAAKEIANECGIASINIRAVAAKCNISVGSIYNYFPTKAELVIAVIEDFWASAFHSIDMKAWDGKRFTDCFQFIYQQLFCYLSDFQHNWIDQLSVLNTREKQMGREKEADYFSHLQEIFLTSLLEDQKVAKDLWKPNFTPSQFAEFALHHLLEMIKSGVQDCSFFLTILEKVLY